MGIRPTLFVALECDESIEQIEEKFKVNFEAESEIAFLYSAWELDSDLCCSQESTILLCYVFNGWGEQHDPKGLEIPMKDAKFLAEFLTNTNIFLTMGVR